MEFCTAGLLAPVSQILNMCTLGSSLKYVLTTYFETYLFELLVMTYWTILDPFYHVIPYAKIDAGIGQKTSFWTLNKIVDNSIEISICNSIFATSTALRSNYYAFHDLFP